MKRKKSFSKVNKAALFTAVSAAVLSMGASAAFTKISTYTDGQFSDVNSEAWFAGEVKNTYELGLMNGIGGGLFNPDGNVTVAESITMAARAYATYIEETISHADGEWYQMYVDYAIKNGFVTEGQFDSFDRPAKRFEVAKLFHDALPKEYYTAKNIVTSIPDVSEEQSYSDELLTLYKAGIVMGSDAYGNFRPEDNITRAEAAAIITRVALPEKRLAKTLDKISDDDAYLLTNITGYSGSGRIGMKTGFLLDNRGGAPSTTASVGTGVITDISTEAGTAVIREFNKTTTGTIVLEAEYSLVKNPDGAYIEYVNEEGKSVYRIEVIDGWWHILGTDGQYTKLRDANVGEYIFRITVDLDNNRSNTVIDGKDFGMHPLAVSDSNVINLRFGSTEEGTPTAGPGVLDMYVNYGVYNKFSFDADGTSPYGWTGGVVKNDILEITGANGASTAFNPVSGNVIAEAEIFLDSKTNAVYALKSGSKNVVLMNVSGSDITVNGQKIYSCYDGLWYRFRFELDTAGMKVLVKINGREIANLDMAEKATSVDNISIYNAGTETLKSDNYKVFNKKECDDYVTAPIKPKGEEKYNVGINVCSLWIEGSHYGWATISPYERPILGYYDEGNPESADWEIKYMVEHGIDFQAFCWFADQSDTYLRGDKLDTHLHDGYMNAKYSDAMKYSIIWEARGGKRPKSMDDFKKYYVPYFIENYFKDPRYMTIDNKPLLYFFVASDLAKSDSLGSNEAVKEALDYLRAEVKKLGFDDLIIIGNSSQKDAAAFGFDGVYTYGWGTTGYRLDVNKQQNLSGADGKPYRVPTISVGFNSIPWHGVRYPLMTGEDFAAAQDWVKTEYLPTYATESWQENLVMLATWNEYGEGTFVMPGENNGGFDYLDALREAYTDEKADEGINTVPTEEQLARINRMYPQYRRHLRDTGYSEMEKKDDEYDVIYEIDFTKETDVNKFRPLRLENAYFDSEKGFTFTSNHYDSFFYLTFNGGFNIDDVAAIRLTADIPAGAVTDLFFVTDKNPNWNSTMNVRLDTALIGENDAHIITLDKKVWNGNMTQMRVDLLDKENLTGSVKKIEFLTKKASAIKTFYINGMQFEASTDNVILDNGTVLSAFDPALAMDFRLNAFHIWDRENGVLTLEFVDHTVVYTVGKDTFTVDGKDIPLGYKLYLEDGLPMIDFSKLCEVLGFTYSFENGVTRINTEQEEYFAELASTDPGCFEFNTPGNTEGWRSSHFELSVGVEGFMRFDQITDAVDVSASNTLSVGLPTENYNAVKIRMRHEIDTEQRRWLSIFFTTNFDGALNEAKSIKKDLVNNGGTEFVEYTVDLSKIETWRGTIQTMRFDPFDAHGWCEVDYIRFYYDDNFDPPYDAVHKDNDGQIGAKFDKFEVVNGDAEGDGGFISQNGNISIVKDPENPGNNCYFVVPKDDKNVYLYASEDIRFNKGATYMLEMDVKIGAHGTNTELDGDFTGNLLVNAQYTDPFGAVDHVVGATPKIKVSDGWYHFSCEFKVNENSLDRSKDKISFFSDPSDGKGVGYYFDNIKITEILPETK